MILDPQALATLVKIPRVLLPSRNIFKVHFQAQKTQMAIRVSFLGLRELENGHQKVHEQLKVFK